MSPGDWKLRRISFRTDDTGCGKARAGGRGRNVRRCPGSVKRSHRVHEVVERSRAGAAQAMQVKSRNEATGPPRSGFVEARYHRTSRDEGAMPHVPLTFGILL